MVKVVHLSEFLGMKIPRIGAHYGTCDYCSTRLVFVLHINEDKEPRGFSICEDCADEIIAWLTAFRLKKEGRTMKPGQSVKDTYFKGRQGTIKHILHDIATVEDSRDGCGPFTSSLDTLELVE